MVNEMIKNIVKVLFSNALLTIVGLINSFVFPIILSIDEYAYYQEYILYISYVNICHLGIASGMFLNYVGHNYKEINKQQYKSEVLLIYVVLGAFSFLGMLMAGISKSNMVLCVVLTIFPQGIIASFQALYQSWDRFTGYAIVNALPKLLFTMLIVLSYFVVKNICGNFVVYIYLVMQWVVTSYFLMEFTRFTKGIKSNKLLSKKNRITTFNGFLITLGNYVNLLFHSIDKQFVHILYSTISFAQYSFAMSTQNIMTIFIAALANPFYARLTKRDVDKDYIVKMKELLIILGAYSGCAFFLVSICVELFIKKYQDSLKATSMFFAVFPAMAVINVLYINLYKIRKKLKKYILTLVGMLMVVCVLNGLSVLLKGDYVGIAFATMISYYIWLFYSQKDFDEIIISKKDIIYLIGYFCIYFGLVNISNNILGLIMYTTLITVWNYNMYSDTVDYLIKIIREKIDFKKDD